MTPQEDATEEDEARAQAGIDLMVYLQQAIKSYIAEYGEDVVQIDVVVSALLNLMIFGIKAMNNAEAKDILVQQIMQAMKHQLETRQ